ncbi:MAG: hypothetical protein IPN77_13710 [Sandaracinaceae bacterium]|nr:hypothetical protein [Sandaracinaceae bacterium]
MRTLSMAALIGCGGGGGGGGVGTTTGPIVQGAPATVILRNVSREAIFYVYMSQSSDSNWGADLLAATPSASGSRSRSPTSPPASGTSA